MPHPLVVQLRFTRREFVRALAGISDADARHRFQPMNSISWIIGHLASAEQTIWLTSLQGFNPCPYLNDLFSYGQPASTPSLAQMWDVWQTVTQMTDPFLDTLTTQDFQERGMMDDDDQQRFRSAGSLLLRVIYHYWYHTGEVMAIRQQRGHPNLPEFVGDLDTQAPYLPH